MIHAEGGKKNRGRPRRTLLEVMRKDMTVLNLSEDITLNQLVEIDPYSCPPQVIRIKVKAC